MVWRRFLATQYGAFLLSISVYTSSQDVKSLGLGTFRDLQVFEPAFFDQVYPPMDVHGFPSCPGISDCIRLNYIRNLVRLGHSH